MKKIFPLLFFALALAVSSCSKPDSPAATSAPFVEYPVQYDTDIATIEKYLNDYLKDEQSRQPC
ncbi:MAG: hypothetical protein EOO48_08185 [Flavobacterium sp.]|nr:MAG: hypothetical protein EOO48_08185 [Flavobacterium sp.]